MLVMNTTPLDIKRAAEAAGRKFGNKIEVDIQPVKFNETYIRAEKWDVTLSFTNEHPHETEELKICHRAYQEFFQALPPYSFILINGEIFSTFGAKQPKWNRLSRSLYECKNELHCQGAESCPLHKREVAVSSTRILERPQMRFLADIDSLSAAADD